METSTVRGVLGVYLGYNLTDEFGRVDREVEEWGLRAARRISDRWVVTDGCSSWDEIVPNDLAGIVTAVEATNALDGSTGGRKKKEDHGFNMISASHVM